MNIFKFKNYNNCLLIDCYNKLCIVDVRGHYPFRQSFTYTRSILNHGFFKRLFFNGINNRDNAYSLCVCEMFRNNSMLFGGTKIVWARKRFVSGGIFFFSVAF